MGLGKLFVHVSSSGFGLGFGYKVLHVGRPQRSCLPTQVREHAVDDRTPASPYIPVCIHSSYALGI